MAGTETVEMLSVMFLFTSVCACIYSTFLLIGKNKEKVKFKVILPPAFGLVGTLGIGNILSITLMGRISAAIQFPLIVGGGIVISGILGVFLYKEQPGWRLYLSIVLLLLGVILIGF
jgi:drug/metabolite transporter (DMT)-like permease